MIEISSEFGPGNADHELIDFGFFQRGALGAKTKRINRKGNRFRVSFSFGPYYPETGSKFVSKLISAKSRGIRLAYPLLIEQGSPGQPVVDGAGQSGTTLAISGLTNGYTCRDGYWLSIENADGQHYLHNVETGGRANAAGELSIVINPELRHPFLDGAKIHLAKPMIEGLVIGDGWQWQSNVNRVVPIEFTVEEAE